MEKSEKILTEYVKAILEEVLEKEYPDLKEIKELKDTINKQNEINSKLENKLEDLEKQLFDSKFTDKIEINSRCVGESKARSFEVYKDILDEFLEFCKTQPYTLKEMVSEAFLRFLLSHKSDKE